MGGNRKKLLGEKSSGSKGESYRKNPSPPKVILGEGANVCNIRRNTSMIIAKVHVN